MQPIHRLRTGLLLFRDLIRIQVQAMTGRGVLLFQTADQLLNVRREQFLAVCESNEGGVGGGGG